MGALSLIKPFRAVPQEIEERALQLLEELGLIDFRNRPFATLSGGFAQRALLVRALLSDPKLLLLDEPTANVDTPSTHKILEKLDALKGEKTILLVTHDLRTIVERVDRLLCVQGHVHSIHSREVCEHFALGLYHTPLVGLPINHFAEGAHCDACLPR